MREALESLIKRLLRVPPEPEPPLGAPGSVQVFRAAPGFFRYRLLGWGLGQVLGLRLADVDSATGKQAIIIGVLTLPVILYFAIMESRPKGATVGKRRDHEYCCQPHCA